MQQGKIRGIGLGLRRDLAHRLLQDEDPPAFVEFAPENWLGVGGYWGRILSEVREQFPITCHGLSLSLGSPEELDWDFIKELKNFLDRFQVMIFSEHLSYCKCENAHLYDLLPIPFREDAVKHVAARIRQVQDYLGRRIAIENVSYYTEVAPEMSEAEFITSIVRESDCDLLLDVNNVYVNAFNHNYDAKQFLLGLPLDRVAYIHMAGHLQYSEDLIIDTHGEPIIDPVYDLFSWSIERLSPVPVLLERDYNLDNYGEIKSELGKLQEITESKWHSYGNEKRNPGPSKRPVAHL